MKLLLLLLSTRSVSTAFAFSTAVIQHNSISSRFTDAVLDVLSSIVSNGHRGDDTVATQDEPQQKQANDIDIQSLDPNYWVGLSEDSGSSNTDDEDLRDDDQDSGHMHEPNDYEHQQLQHRDLAIVPAKHHLYFADYYKANGYRRKRVLLVDDKYFRSVRKKKRLLDAYPVDEPGVPLQRTPDQFISPREGIARKYFNISDFRPWRPSHDVVRPPGRQLWRDLHVHTYCLLGGVGKREINWQPDIARDLFDKPVKFGDKEPATKFFQHFWNRDPATNKFKAFSIFLSARAARKLHKDSNKPRTKKAREVLEACRLYCQTCFDAAKETGSEQFLCSRMDSGKDDFYDYRHVLTSAGNCRSAMVVGDPMGRENICQKKPYTNPVCEEHVEKELSQPIAPRNIYPSLRCNEIFTCQGPRCTSDNKTTVLLEEADWCWMTSPDAAHFMSEDKIYNVPRFGLLGHQTLASAMNDTSIKTYYNDFTPWPGMLEKAFLLGSRRLVEFPPINGLYPWPISTNRTMMEREMGAAWEHWKEGDPPPVERFPLNYTDAKEVSLSFTELE